MSIFRQLINETKYEYSLIPYRYRRKLLITIIFINFTIVPIFVSTIATAIYIVILIFTFFNLMKMDENISLLEIETATKKSNINYLIYLLNQGVAIDNKLGENLLSIAFENFKDEKTVKIIEIFFKKGIKLNHYMNLKTFLDDLAFQVEGCDLCERSKELYKSVFNIIFLHNDEEFNSELKCYINEKHQALSEFL